MGKFGSDDGAGNFHAANVLCKLASVAVSFPHRGKKGGKFMCELPYASMPQNLVACRNLVKLHQIAACRKILP